LYYFKIVGMYSCVGCMDAPLKDVCTASLSIVHTTCHFQGIKQTLFCVRFSKFVQLHIHPPLNTLAIPDWLNVKFHYFLIGSKVNNLNTLTPLAFINVTLFHCRHPCELLHASYRFLLMCKRA